MPQKKNLLVISALGKDHPGIVNQLSGAIHNMGCNILDSRMMVLGGEFAVLMLVEGNWNTLAKLEDTLPQLQKRLDLVITSKRTEKRRPSSELLPYAVDVIALDHPGIVHSLAGFFSERQINIEELSTSSYAAPHTGTPMFAVHINVGIPANLHIASLRDEFMEFCDAMNLDAVLEPIKG